MTPTATSSRYTGRLLGRFGRHGELVSGAEVNVAGVAAGSATVTVTATDPGGLSATQTFDVTVVVLANRDPVPEGTIDALTVTAGESATVDDGELQYPGRATAASSADSRHG